MADQHAMTRRALLQSALFLPVLRHASLPSLGDARASGGIRPVPLTSVSIRDAFSGAAHGRQPAPVDLALLRSHAGERRLRRVEADRSGGLHARARAGSAARGLRRRTHCRDGLGAPRAGSPRPIRPCGFQATSSRRRLCTRASPGNGRCSTPRWRTAGSSTPTSVRAARTYVSEHEGQKIGLIALARETGDERYWRLAQFFLDARGRDGYPRRGVYATDRTYAQDQAPVVDQREAVGHCVRATFLYIALTDIAAHTGDERYRRAADAIWEDVVFRKMYLTGGIGRSASMNSSARPTSCRT